ncbi:MAG: TIGR03663 family protein, partial [Candidatus Syntrophoarchaeum sp. WYZ-LMO15]
LILILVLRYIETPNLHSAALAGLTAGLATSAKENAYVILFIFVSFGILYLIRERGRIRGKELVRENLPAIVTAIVVGCIVYYLFYSFFLKHPYDPFTAIPHAIDHWSSYTGGPSGPFYFYIPLMALYELPVLIFGVCGIIYYWVREKNNTLMLFLTYYFAFLMIVQASLHEKAPWLTVHLILPLSIIAAGFIERLIHINTRWVKRAAITVLGITFIFMVANSLALNYIRFVDPAEPMIQAAQPDMHFKEMISRVNEVASGLDGHNTRIIVTDPKLETQLLWNLRDYKKVRWRVDINSTLDAPLIFVHDLDADLVEKRLEERGYMRMEGRILQWYWWKPHDVNLRFILFREMDRDPDGYGIVLFYKE